MNKFTALLYISLIVSFQTTAQFSHSGRGMYVDKFFRLATNTSGVTVVNPVFSILSIPAKEDSLLQYAKDNHITYLVLYDLYYVFGNPTYENYLCAFLTKAKSQYCIEEIGVASSCSGLFDNIFAINPTPAINLSDPGRDGAIQYSPVQQDQLSIVQNRYSPGDSMFYISEVTKLSMRVAAFNDNCAYKLDVLVSEYEFWNTTVDDCVGDSPTRDQKYLRYQTLITNMDAVRDNYNSTHSAHHIYVETYLGYINLNTAYTHQAIADWIDGMNNGNRRVDRVNTHYYGSDPSRLYSRTSAGQNNTGYYLTRFLDFCQASTNNQTYMHPIYSSEYIPWGGGASYLGGWFSQSVNNNIFTAEKDFYNDWYDDAVNYHPATVGSPTLGTVIQPGGVLWFTSSQMSGHLNRPIMYTSNSPVCVASGQNGNLQFQYQGPFEQGVSFKFYITNSGTSTIVCGTTNSIAWPPYNPVTQTSIDLNAALSSCALPVGDYDAHLELTYASGCSPYIAPLMRVSVVNSGKIVALTATTVCQGNPVYLQASSTGGGTTTYVWYDGNTAINGATSSTYAPVATSTGAHNFSCLITSSAGTCSVNRSNIIPVTINTYPAASITTQSTSVCSVTLQANPTGASYLWNDGSTGATYTTGYSGTYSVQVTQNGCTSNSPSFAVTSLSGSGTVTPAVSISSGVGTTICTGTNATFTATTSNGGSAPSYQWKKNGNNVGTNSPTYSNNTLANGEIISCVLTSNLSCASPVTATSNSLTMTINPIVAPYVSISSNTGNLICTGTNVTFTATPTNGGATPSYQWKKNSISVGSNSPTYSDNTLVTSDVINCTMTSSVACPSVPTVTSSNIIMTVNPNVTPVVTISANPGNSICSGTNVTFTAVSTNGGSTPVFQWKKNGVNIGTNSNSFSSTSLTNNDVITCVLTSNLLCLTTPTDTSNSITMTVTTISTPSVSISSNSGSTICSGTNVIFTAAPVNGGASPVYQWKKNGTVVGTNSTTYSNNSLANNDVLTCTMTSSVSCASPATVTSNSVTMTVNASVTASVSISVSPGSTICAGTNVTFTAAPVNGGVSPIYQWKKNGVNAGTNNINFSSGTLANNDAITCTMTSNATCSSPASVTSNGITMVVTPVSNPSVSVSSNNGNTICFGTNVTFTASPVNGGASPFYQWKKNGINTGLNTNLYSDNALANNDIILCVMTGSASCSSPPTVNSNSITMLVNANVTPSVTISPDAGNIICSGTNVNFNATVSGGGSIPIYQWKKNGVNAGSNSNIYSDNALNNNDVISCNITSNASCASPMTATSNNVTMSVFSNVVPSLTIGSGLGNTICSGTNVTFTANPLNGGSTPAYQWKINGVNSGSNSGTFSNNTLANNDVVSCVMTSNQTCASPTIAQSNNVTMTVIPLSFPSVSISSNSGNTICHNAFATFTAATVNGGASPFYQWKKNGANVGLNMNFYSDNTLANNDIVSCVMTSSISCSSPPVVSSNSITMTVNANVTPSVTISSDLGNTICGGTVVTFTATPVNGGATPLIQWKKNGVNIGPNNISFSSGTLANSDVISCTMLSSAPCASPASVTSNSIAMSVNPVAVPSVSISANPGNIICSGTTVIFTATPVNGGTTPVYQWKKNGTNVGINSGTYSYFSLLTSDIISCSLTSNVACAAPQTVLSNNISMSVKAIVTPSVSIISNSGNLICSGTNVQFTATPVNGGNAPTYQWFKNGISVGINSNTYSNNTLVNNDSIKCVMTSNETCLTTNPVTSNIISMSVNTCSQFTLNLKTFIQGYYSGNGRMTAVSDPLLHPTLCDTITVELHFASPPYLTGFVKTDTINIYGNGVFVFPGVVLNQSYYIVVRHRNALETWSKNPLTVTGPSMNYDFTISAGNAFGNNVADLGDGNFALWSGDVTNGIVSGVQDGIINNYDYIELKNTVTGFITGYRIDDVDGDGIVESADFSMVEFNASMVITLARP